MGRVYTVEDLRAGNFPATTEAHEAAAGALMATIEEMNASRPRRECIDAMVYGSVALQKHTRRSDVDGLYIVSDETEPADTKQLDEQIRAIWQKTHVTIEPHAVSRYAAQRRHHTMMDDLLFVEHLKVAARHSPYKIGEPGDHLRSLSDYYPDLSDQVRIARNTTYAYIERKKVFASNARRSNELSATTVLQRCLELPAALMRKMVRVEQLVALRDYGEWDRTLPDTMRGVRPDFEQRALSLDTDNPTWHTPVRWLAACNNEYGNLLESTIAGTTSFEAYGSWIHQTTAPAIDHAYALSHAARTLLLAAEQSEFIAP